MDVFLFEDCVPEKTTLESTYLISLWYSADLERCLLRRSEKFLSKSAYNEDNTMQRQ